MSDHLDEAAQAAVQPTDPNGVDEVLQSLTTLDSLPVAEHVAVFERAHEQLRRALDVPRSA